VTGARFVASVIIPAHNEARVIRRLLDQLLAQTGRNEFEVVVICNGCTDDTAAIARAHPGVTTVLELAEGSKHLALVAGDQTATGFPRLYVDADVELDTASARRLIEAVSGNTVLAAAPRRELELTHSSWGVRAYYDIWGRLPSVQEGLYGRGVLAVSEAGYARIADRPQLIGDDLYVHTRYSGSERLIVEDAISLVYGPRTLTDLLRRRIRAAEGNTELAETATTSASSGRALLGLLGLGPSHVALWPRLAVFVSVTLIARLRAKVRAGRRGTTGWLRDESSRGG
jgi:hypothetical protein